MGSVCEPLKQASPPLLLSSPRPWLGRNECVCPRLDGKHFPPVKMMPAFLKKSQRESAKVLTFMPLAPSAKCWPLPIHVAKGPATLQRKNKHPTNKAMVRVVLDCNTFVVLRLQADKGLGKDDAEKMAMQFWQKNTHVRESAWRTFHDDRVRDWCLCPAP